MDLTVEDCTHFMRNCDRDRGLADAARPHDRHELLLGQLQLDGAHRISSSKHPHQARRHSPPRGRFEIFRLQGTRGHRYDKAVPPPRYVRYISPAGITLIESLA